MTLFDIQCCQFVIRKLVNGFMSRLESYVNYIIKDILAHQFAVLYPGFVNPGAVYCILIVDRTNYIIHIVYNYM